MKGKERVGMRNIKRQTDRDTEREREGEPIRKMKDTETTQTRKLSDRQRYNNIS